MVRVVYGSIYAGDSPIGRSPDGDSRTRTEGRQPCLPGQNVMRVDSQEAADAPRGGHTGPGDTCIVWKAGSWMPQLPLRPWAGAGGWGLVSDWVPTAEVRRGKAAEERLKHPHCFSQFRNASGSLAE